MKKILSLVLALCMVFALCACGAAEEAAVMEEPVSQTDAAPAAAVSQTDAAPAGDASGEPAQDASGEPSDEPSSDASGTPEAPIAAADQPVADHAEAIALELDPDAHYFAFTGDMHGEVPGYRVWLEDILAVYDPQFEVLNYSGDICEKNWDQSTFDTWKAVLDELVPGRYNVTTGNQEWKAGAPGATLGDLGEGFTFNGEAAASGDYLIYNLGSASENMIFTQEQIDALAAWLAEAPANVPVFVLSHFPLHLSVATATHSIPGGDHRQTENNAALIEVLNQYPNVIFLWGHNHTFQDPRYGTICLAGSLFTYDYNNPTEKIEINFTYANYGSFCRGDSYGLLAEVQRTEDGVQVNLDYIDTNVPMTTKDSAVITILDSGDVTADVTAGTGIDYAEIQSMSGYPDDPSFMDEF